MDYYGFWLQFYILKKAHWKYTHIHSDTHTVMQKYVCGCVTYMFSAISIISICSRRHLKDIDSFISKHISEHIRDKSYRSYKWMKVSIFSCRFIYLECPECEHISQTVHITRVEKNSLATILLPPFGGCFSSQLGSACPGLLCVTAIGFFHSVQ